MSIPNIAKIEIAAYRT